MVCVCESGVCVCIDNRRGVCDSVVSMLCVCVCVCVVLLRIENRVLRIKNRVSILEDQGSGSDTKFCPLWLSI